MAKLERDRVVTEALVLLDEVGLDAVSTRALARRLGVEQPSLYWHFANKRALLEAMAHAAMAPHAEAPLPVPGDDWADWFTDNTRSFRHALLGHRDGARLHAGSTPDPQELPRIVEKLRFLSASGVGEAQAQMGMLAASRFTVGSVLEEQADPPTDSKESTDSTDRPADVPPTPDHTIAFEHGLALIVTGMRR